MIQGICTRPSEGFTLCTPNPTKYTPRLAKTRDKKETKSHKKGENKTPPRHRTPNHSTQGSSRSIAALICAYYLGTTVLLPPMNPFHGEAANLFTEHFERRPYLPPRTSHNGWLRTNTPRPSRKMGYFHNYLAIAVVVERWLWGKHAPLPLLECHRIRVGFSFALICTHHLDLCVYGGLNRLGRGTQSLTLSDAHTSLPGNHTMVG